MAVLAMIELEVEDVELLVAAKKELMDPVAEPLFARHGHLWQLVARTGAGLLVLNLWESEEGRERANGDSRLTAAREAVLERAGAKASYRCYPVLAYTPTSGVNSER